MTEYLARKPMTVAGARVGAGEPVPMQNLTGDRRRQLIKQKRVIKNQVSAGSRGRRSSKK